MPNWCECYVTVTGKPNAIECFLRTELKAYDDDGKPEEIQISEGRKILCISSKSQNLFILGMQRAYSPVKVEFRKNTSELNLFLLSAWDINAKELAILSEKYNIDFSVSGEEPNMEFFRNILVRNGKIEIDETENFSES